MAIYKMIPRPAYPLVLAMLWLAAGTAAAQPSDFERFAATFRELPDGPLPEFGQPRTCGDSLTTAQARRYFWQPLQTAKAQGLTLNRFENQMPFPFEDGNEVTRHSDERATFAKYGRYNFGGYILLVYCYEGNAHRNAFLGVLHYTSGEIRDVLLLSGFYGPCILSHHLNCEIQKDAQAGILIRRNGTINDQMAYNFSIEFPHDDVPSWFDYADWDYRIRIAETSRFIADTAILENIHGVYQDNASGEWLAVDSGSDRTGPRAAYRANARKPWSFPAITHLDRPRRSLTIRFSNSPTTYRLVQSPDGHTLTSTGSDGSAPQVFRRVRPAP